MITTASLATMGEIAAAAQLQLCELDEPASVRIPHVAALLACAAAEQQQYSDAVLRLRVEHRPTALWVLETLKNLDTEVLSDRTGVTIGIVDPCAALRSYGFRGQQCWSFGKTADAALGAARGAVHAGARLTLHGLKLSCPTPAMMLTLTVMMERLGIDAAPSPAPVTGMPRLAVSPTATADALRRLGLSVAGNQFSLLRAARA